MHRSSNKNPYAQVGVPAHATPGGKRRSPLRRILRWVITVAVILIVILLLAWGISSAVTQSGKPVRINASPLDNIQAMGENVVYYDGMTIFSVNGNGGTNWHYSLGTGGDFWATDTMVAAWTGSQVVVLDDKGKSIYNDRMEGDVRFARAGESYVGVCYSLEGADLVSRVRVITHAGAIMETIDFTDLYMLDLGFFTAKGQLMWVLGLDVNGNSPMVNLSTYEPGKLSAGAVDLPDQLAYKVYAHNNNLMVVDTSKIHTYNYKCVELTDIASVLVYGWQVKQVLPSGRNTYALLEQMPGSTGGDTFSELRLVTNYDVKSLRLLSPCFASGLSDKGIYGFGENVVYFAPYGSSAFKGTSLTYTLTGFKCMLKGSRAVLVSGNEVFIMKLPTK